MAININADTTNGLVITSDNSGEINFQNAGSTVATIHSSGLSMGAGMTLPASALSGTLPSIDASSLTNIPASNLIGALPAIDGSALTNIVAGEINASTYGADKSSGYIKTNDGFILQWGHVISGTWGFVTVNLPIAFPNACIGVQANIRFNSNYRTNYHGGVWVNSASQIVVGRDDASTDGTYWLAYGY